MRKTIALLLIFSVLLLAGCTPAQETSGSTAATEGSPLSTRLETTVGICLPNQTDQRWIDDGAALAGFLTDMGFQTLLQDAQDDPWLQAEQISQLIAQEADCLVIAAVDSLLLTEALQQAKQENIPVVAYDRMLTQTDAVSCYVAFQYEDVGLAIAEYIITAKQLQTAQAEQRSYTIEFLMGSPEDNNALLLHTGIMRALQSYLDSGVLVCPSGRVSFEDTCIQGWSEQLAAERCGEFLEPEVTPDILCAASDSIAQGCALALADNGTQEDWPLITGQDAQESALERIAQGTQAMTVYKDTGLLAEKCAQAVQSLLAGTLSADTCHNGMIQVPAVFCLPVTVDTGNYQELLDSTQ